MGTPMFQQRNFVVIAQLIATLDTPTRLYVAVHFANGLAKHNPNFKRERFINACKGVEREPGVNEWIAWEETPRASVKTRRAAAKLLLKGDTK